MHAAVVVDWARAAAKGSRAVDPLPEGFEPTEAGHVTNPLHTALPFCMPLSAALCPLPSALCHFCSVLCVHRWFAPLPVRSSPVRLLTTLSLTCACALCVRCVLCAIAQVRHGAADLVPAAAHHLQGLLRLEPRVDRPRERADRRLHVPDRHGARAYPAFSAFPVCLSCPLLRSALVNVTPAASNVSWFVSRSVTCQHSERRCTIYRYTIYVYRNSALCPVLAERRCTISALTCF